MRKQVRHLAKHNGLNSSEYKRNRNAYNKAIKKAKNAGWRAHCNETVDVGSAAGLLRRLKAGRTPDIQLIKKQNGEFSRTPKETVCTLLDTHFPDSASRGATQRCRPASRDDVNFIENTFNSPAVKKAFNSFKPYKAAGADGIPPILLQHLPDDFITYTY